MYFQDIINTVIEPTLLKLAVSGAFAFSFLFGDFHQQAIIAVLMLMVFDTVLGVMATYHEGRAITSRKFSRVVQKGVVYFMAISAGYFADLTIGWQVIQATMIAFIGVTEFISILENMGRLGYSTPQRLLNQLQDFKSAK
jgi:toxin secretion/phage lysis holin